MKTKCFFLLACLLLLATGCATQKTTTSNAKCVVPVYYNGNDEPVTGGVFLYSEEQLKNN
jgi:uncharacterized lipoprotein YajG